MARDELNRLRQLSKEPLVRHLLAELISVFEHHSSSSNCPLARPLRSYLSSLLHVPPKASRADSSTCNDSDARSDLKVRRERVTSELRRSQSMPYKTGRESEATTASVEPNDEDRQLGLIVSNLLKSGRKSSKGSPPPPSNNEEAATSTAKVLSLTTSVSGEMKIDSTESVTPLSPALSV